MFIRNLGEYLQFKQKSNKFVTTMRAESEIIHLRIPRNLSDILNKLAFDSGMSKQDILRYMVFKQLEVKFEVSNLILDIEKIKNQLNKL